MPRLRALLSLGVLVGACQTPYQRMGVLGGYEDHEVSPGRYVVTVKVNGHTDRGTALEYLHRRAGELCPIGYDVVSSSSGDNGDVLANTKKPEISAMIQCSAADRDDDRRAAAPAEALPYYCTTAPGDSSVGECARSLDGCAKAQQRVADIGGDATVCTAAPMAVCFAYERDGHRKARCAPTLGSCERSRGGLAAQRAVTACVNVAAGAGMTDVPFGPAPVIPAAPPAQ